MQNPERQSLIHRVETKVVAGAVAASLLLTGCFGGKSNHQLGSANEQTAPTDTIAPPDSTSSTTLEITIPSTTTTSTTLEHKTTTTVRPSTTTTAKAPAATTTIKPALTIAQCVANMSSRELEGRVLVGGMSVSAMPTLASTIKRYHVGAVFIQGNDNTPFDGKILEFKKAANNLEVMADVEGGTVNRFPTLGSLPSEQAMAASHMPPAVITQMVKNYGLNLKKIGDDVVLGPVLDTAPLNKVSVLGSRIFSTDPNVVATDGLAVIEGWKQAGLIPVAKHFVGMGEASQNTDNGPATTLTYSQLKIRDQIPFKKVASIVPAMMDSNVDIPGLTTKPASLSPQVIKIMRNDLDFKGVIMTDSLTAGAIKEPIAQAVVDALKAGNNEVLFNLPSSSPSIVAPYLGNIIAAEGKAVSSHTLSLQQLRDSVKLMLATQGDNPCKA